MNKKVLIISSALVLALIAAVFAFTLIVSSRNSVSVNNALVPNGNGAELLVEPFPNTDPKEAELWSALYNVTGNPVEVFNSYRNAIQDSGFEPTEYVSPDISKKHRSKQGCYEFQSYDQSLEKYASVGCGLLFIDDDKKFTIELVVSRGEPGSNEFDEGSAGSSMSIVAKHANSESKNVSERYLEAQIRKSKDSKKELVPLPSEDDFEPSLGAFFDPIGMTASLGNSCWSTLYSSDDNARKGIQDYLDSIPDDPDAEYDTPGPDASPFSWDDLEPVQLGDHSKWKKISSSGSLNTGEESSEVVTIFESDSKTIVKHDRCYG